MVKLIGRITEPSTSQSRERNGNLLQYACLENPMDRGAWWAIVQGACKDSDTTEHSIAPPNLM